MGMYTELHFNAELRRDTPEDVLHILQHMLGEGDAPGALPNHPLFQCARWSYMLVSDSYYFAADTHSTLRFDDVSNSHYLCIRCNMKNYTGEIPNFIDWIMPYVDALPGDFLGFSRYEEKEEPTLIYAPNNTEKA